MEWRFFDEGTIPECTTADWYEGRERAPHLEQGAHQGRLLTAANHVGELARTIGATTLVDLGAGDGGFISQLGPAHGLNAWGYDLSPENCHAATTERGVNVKYADFLADPIEWADIAVCTEVIEHLLDPHGFLRTARTRCRGIVASSPANETPESHYEHHLWAWDLAGYAALFRDAGFVVVRHDVVGGMFQVVTAITAEAFA